MQVSLPYFIKIKNLMIMSFKKNKKIPSPYYKKKY